MKLIPFLHKEGLQRVGVGYLFTLQQILNKLPPFGAPFLLSLWL
jgi:hypothetical protein